MGRAKIISGGPAGLYQVEIVHDMGRSTERLAAIEKRQAELAELIEAAGVSLTSSIAAAEQVLVDLNAAIAAMNAGTGTREQVLDWQNLYAVREADAAGWRRSISRMKYETVSLVKEKEILETARQTVAGSAWCADLTENLAAGTEVGTIEINGEGIQILLTPGGITSGALGYIQPTALGTPAGTFWNDALLPCWQRWKPTYRAATITAINYERDTCSIVLHAAKSSAQGLNINPTEASFSNVPITYLTCNAGAFAAGDAVVVDFQGQSWTSPKVIGFLSNPKPCVTFVNLRMRWPVGSSEFIAIAQARVDDWNRDIGYANYCKNTFVQQVLNYYDSLVGKYYNIVGGIPWGQFKQADADRYKQPWIDWRDSKAGANQDLGYNSYIASAEEARGAWNTSVYFAAYADDIMYFRQCEATGNPDDIWSAPSLHLKSYGYTWKIDCDTVLAQTAIISPSGSSTFERDRNVSLATETLWRTLDVPAVPKSKIYYAMFTLGSFFDFFFEARGVIDSDSRFYLLTRGYTSNYSSAKPPDNVVITASVGDGAILKYPSPNNYHAMYTSLKGPFATTGIEMAFKAEARLANIPTSFGGYIDPGNVVGNYIYTMGGPKADDPFSWCGRFLREQTPVPYGFEMFAGRYPDHPIVTGIDYTTPRAWTDQQASNVIAEVQQYVASKYAYVEDGEAQDIWSIMSDINTSGDCEDFALTKIQLLLDRGFPIARMRLQAGFKYVSYSPKVYDDDGVEILKAIGHVWLLIDSNTVLDQAGPVKTLDAMTVYQERMTQSKLVWTVDATGEKFTAVPWPHTTFSSAMMTMNLVKAE